MYRCMFLLGVILSCPGLPAHAADIGMITSVAGEVGVIRDTGYHLAEAGSVLTEQDMIKTGPDSEAQIELPDDTVLQIGAATTVHLSAYRQTGKDRGEHSEISLVQGWLRFITAQLSGGADYTYTTPTLALGIRGTQGVLFSDAEVTDIWLEQGQAEVQEWDSEGRTVARHALAQGRFFNLRRGRPGQVLEQNPAFQLPPHFQRRLERRRAHMQAKKLRKLREVDYEDVVDLLDRHPRLRRHFLRQFHQRLQDPQFRRKLRQKLARHPEWREYLRQFRRPQK